MTGNWFYIFIMALLVTISLILKHSQRKKNFTLSVLKTNNDQEQLGNRNITIQGDITEQMAMSVLTKLLYLEDKNPSDPIQLWISSTGGSVVAGMAIIEGMNQIECDVETVCVGYAGGMAAIILAAGTKGMRSCTETARVLLFPPHGPDSKNRELELKKRRALNRLIKTFAEFTSRSPVNLLMDLKNSRELNASEAIAFGIVDTVKLDSQ